MTPPPMMPMRMFVCPPGQAQILPQIARAPFVAGAGARGGYCWLSIMLPIIAPMNVAGPA